MKKLLPLVWVGSLGSLAVLGSQLQGESTQFFGIADESEQTVSFGYPVEVVEILVTEAAAVEPGTPLLRVHRPDLSAQLTLIDDRIRTALAVRQGAVDSLNVKLRERIAERAAQLAELDVQIRALRSRRALNTRLLNDIAGGGGGAAGSSPLMAELNALLEQRQQVDSSLNEQIDGLRAQLEHTVDPFEAELAELNDRKAELERQHNDLSVRATATGRVGSINVRAGEQADSFKSILTVHGESPRFVKGYIHENVYNELTIGQTVWVQPVRLTPGTAAIQAEVESLGSRIVEYPARLNRNPQFPAWGREAVIRLPEGSRLLLGEKVVISVRARSGAWSDRVAAWLNGPIAAAYAATPELSAAQAISSRLAEVDESRLEASGVVAEPRGDRFLIVSDELPQLLTMNLVGEIIDSEPLLLGDGSIDDIESISRNGDSLFVAASLSFTRRGNRRAERCRLVRLRETPDGYRPTAQLDLCTTLDQLAMTARDAGTRQYLSEAIADRTMDVEAMAVRDDHLYLGFKRPLDGDGRTVIVVLGQLNALLQGAVPEGHIWQRQTLLDPASGASALLSDMVLWGEDLLLLGISYDDDQPASHVWRLQADRLRWLATVAGVRAEGISDRPVNGRRLIVDDGGGSRPSQYLFTAAGT